jgi:hypothetical protein
VHVFQKMQYIKKYILTLLGLLAFASSQLVPSATPKAYVAYKLQESDKIVIDGKLDDRIWSEVWKYINNHGYYYQCLNVIFRAGRMDR